MRPAPWLALSLLLACRTEGKTGGETGLVDEASPDDDGDGYTVADGDCDDADAGVNPGAAESCNGVDDDCDGEVDEGVLATFYADADGDGYGDAASTAEACEAPTGFVTDPLDPDTDGDGVDDASDAAPLTDACSTSLLFYDDFTSDPTTSGWTVVSGTWSWDGAGAWSNTDSIAGANAWIGATSWTDYVVEVGITLDTGDGDAGLMARAQTASAVNDDGNDYDLGIYPGDGEVCFGSQDGSWNEFGCDPVATGAGMSHVLQLRLAGSDLEVWPDGSWVSSYPDTTCTWGGIGIRTYDSPATYDYVLACE